MAKATIRIPKDSKHRIVIPNEIWEVENLYGGDIIEVEIKKMEKPTQKPQTHFC
jgi:bifunctional DNA-binding transcriptional regulator/antitoxin component of YhaV-PrlF toxin-antitoxin module